ncbi:hypothetical protein VIGAN_06269100 [Vigna angularis var. angularis]|uniref:Serine-threonine kinase receptor-associated protein n=1 Tax=Vigna angularis var. angularis TaxID=157739 RepID=A0A0S3SF38_PHAAN|nr:hypothetical protein VIGAN_06269100 [Vigna angularis var. angularis]
MSWCYLVSRGHNGAVWSCDVSGDSARLITGSADQIGKLWSVQTGHQLYSFNFDSPARSVDFSVGDKLAVITERPLNAVAMSPLLDHVVIGGGQEDA